MRRCMGCGFTWWGRTFDRVLAYYNLGGATHGFHKYVCRKGRRP